MADIDVVCKTCDASINTVFGSAGTRQKEFIFGDLLVSDQCFVRDEIHFVNGGRLIFANTGKEYLSAYMVVCRKLSVSGGHKPVVLDPCSGDDPGGQYTGSNVITWQDRLKTAADGTNFGSAAADGSSFNTHAYQDQGQGNDGKDGGHGADGSKGNTGGGGRNAPHQLTLVVAQVDMGATDVLIVDWDGQTGGSGGRGQKGGRGGDGMGGNKGSSDTTWPGTGCDREPGNGGNGGRGGDGAPGGHGGGGGDAGDIIVISTLANITSGPLVSGNVIYVDDGGTGGKGGGSNVGGRGGKGGKRGNKTSECDEASDGVDGVDGDPQTPFPPNADPGVGATGAHGAGGSLKIEQLTSGNCSDLLPIPMTFDPGGLQPNAFCRPNLVPTLADASITGQNLSQVIAVTVNLANVTATIKNSSTDTQLDLRLQIPTNAEVGLGDLTFKRGLGPDQVLPNAIEVDTFSLTNVAPNTGAKGTQVNVTISGHCFDTGASLQQVQVSGIGVNAINILVVNDHTITCTFDIGAVAPSTSRDVTVKLGSGSPVTLANAFTVS
jgi:hypothetical protein